LSMLNFGVAPTFLSVRAQTGMSVPPHFLGWTMH
jgi:hypothetical protein